MKIRFLSDVGDYKQGDEIELEDAVANAYVESGVAEMIESDEPEETKTEDKDDLEKAISKITNHIDKRLNTALKSKVNAPVKLPAQARDSKNGIKSLGQFLQIMGLASKGSHSAREKLRMFQKAPTGHNETTGSEGGFLVPEEWSNNLYDKMRNKLFLLDHCNVTPTKRLVYNFPIVNDTSRATGSRPLRYYAIGEGADFTASKAVFGNVQTSLTKFGLLSYVTSEELVDNAYGLEKKLGEFASDELRFAFNDQIINGDGNTPNQTGVLAANCLVTVAKESGQAAATINFANLKKMWARLDAAFWNTANWYVNQFALSELISLAFDPAADDKSSAYGLTYDVRDSVTPVRLFGRPVYPCEQCAALGNAGDIILADLSAMSVAHHEIDVAVSDQLNFVNDEIVYRWSVRFATKPLWSGAMTPYKGSQTTSPFVVIESRGTA